MTTIPRFDGEAVWDSLSLAEQSAFGSIALELVAGWHAQREHGTSGPLGRAASDAVDYLVDELQQLFVMSVPRATTEPDGVAAIPSMTGPLCDACGAAEPCATCSVRRLAS